MGVAGRVSPTALGSGGDTQTRLPRRTQEGWGSLGASAGCLCPPSRSLSIHPLPASCFCFGAEGTSSSHHGSKWLAALSQRPSVRLVTPDQGTSAEGGRGGLCIPGRWRGPLRCDPSHSTAAGAPDKAAPAPRGFCCEHCLRPRWLDPAGVTLHSHCGPFLPQTEDPEGFLPYPSSCFLPGTLVLDTGSQGQRHAGPRGAHTHVLTHACLWPHQEQSCSLLDAEAWPGGCPCVRMPW